jgi:hypothetical protein
MASICRVELVEPPVGQRNLSVTADTYSHVLADEQELDYARLVL